MKRSERNRMLKSAIETDPECKRLARQMKKAQMEVRADYVEKLNARKKELRAKVEKR